jgi:NTE family protein
MTKRALVLGGGGITGVGWEIGMLAGLAAAGVRLADADLVVGTSAGAVAGALLRSGVPIEELYARQLDAPCGEIPARLGVILTARIAHVLLTTRDLTEAGRRFGRLALATRTMPEQERRDVIASRLPSSEWPDRPLLITALDAGSGELRVFDAAGGVSLVDAVTASCAVPGVWPPATIEGRRYIDGGMRTLANADLAAGYERVVVLVPADHGGGPMTSAARQVAALGSDVGSILLTRDRASRAAAGRNPLDPVRRGPSARTGREQAAAVAAQVAAVWG